MTNNTFLIKKINFDLEPDFTGVSVYIQFEKEEAFLPFRSGWVYKKFPSTMGVQDILNSMADLNFVMWERKVELPFSVN